MRPRARRCCCGCGSPRRRAAGARGRAADPGAGRAPPASVRRRGGGGARRPLRVDASRWGQTLKPLQLAFVSHLVPSFTGSIETSLALPCSYDFDVAANKYLYSLVEGVAPLLLLFSGTWFSGTSGGLTVLPIPWDKEVDRRAAGRDLARRDGPALPGHGVATARPGHLRRALPVPRRERHGVVGRGGHPAAQGGRRVTTFEDVRPIADTVLYEGYVLYPYRADDAKNRVRWQFGVLAPPALVRRRPVRALPAAGGAAAGRPAQSRVPAGPVPSGATAHGAPRDGRRRGGGQPARGRRHRIPAVRRGGRRTSWTSTSTWRRPRAGAVDREGPGRCRRTNACPGAGCGANGSRWSRR